MCQDNLEFSGTYGIKNVNIYGVLIEQTQGEMTILSDQWKFPSRPKKFGSDIFYIWMGIYLIKQKGGKQRVYLGVILVKVSCTEIFLNLNSFTRIYMNSGISG